MSKVSDVIVRWNPELSTRAVSTQIESRIKGDTAWTEQANGIDPELGVFRFNSNAPGALVEVRMRIRSNEGVYDDWEMMEVQTTDIVTSNAELEQAVRDAVADAKAAKDRYAEMAADDKFDPVEKQEVRIKLAEYAKEVARWTAQATSAGIVTEKNNYQTAYDSLVSYLNANGVNSLNTTNAINRTEFTAKFTDYIDKRSLLITAIAEKGSKTADYGQITNRPGSLRDINSGEYNTISLNSTDAIARANAAKAIIDAVIDNNVLDRAEKPGVIQDWAEIVLEQAILSLQASDRGVSFTPVSDAKNALANYLGSLSPAWDNPNVDTPISRDTYKARWTDYYTARTNLIAQIDKKAIQREDQLFSGLDKISSDGWLDQSEKADVILRWRSLNDRQTIAVNRYNDLGGPSNSTGFRDTAGARISDLATYLGGLSPTWNDRTTATPINRTDFDNAWANAIKAVQTFEISLVGNTSSEIRQSIAILQLANQDGYWTIAEKIGDIIPHDASLEALYQQLMSQSAPFAGESVVANARSAAGTARSNWTNYRDSVRPFWNDKTQASQIDRTTADARLREYELALDAVGLSITKYVDTRASFAVDRLASISSDSVLDMSEKYKTVIEWQSLNAEYNSFNIKRAALNYPADTNAAANRAYNAIDPSRSGSLGQYLGNLSPAWNDSTTNTPINANDWKNKWIEALSAMGEYRAAITGQKGEKGDPGAPGTSTTTEPTSAQTSYSNQGLYHGWRGPAASLSLNAGQTATIELALYLSSNQGVSVTGYIQCFNSSDQHVANVNNAAVYVSSGEPEQLYIAGSFTNNSGSKQTYNFHGHTLLSPQINITAGGGSYISVRK